MEGSLSQSSDLGPSFHFVKCRNLYKKKSPKVIRFLSYNLKVGP